MVNILIKKPHLTAMIVNPKTGKLEGRPVKVDSTNCKQVHKFSKHIEESIRQKKRNA